MKNFSLDTVIQKVITHKHRFKWVAFVFLIASIFLINTFHDSYPDEFDNILGGRYILEGRLPHSGFFTHHGPVAYFVAAIVQLFSGVSFVRFRIVYSFLLLGLTFAGYIFLKKRFKQNSAFYPVFIFVLAIAATYFWAHMLLADNLSGFILTPIYLLLILSAIFKRQLTLRDMGAVSICSFLSLLSSLTYTYYIAILYLFSLYLYFKDQPAVLWRKPRVLIKPFIILALPYGMFLFYLLLTGGVREYVKQNIVFNERYYIYNYPRVEGSGTINPIRFAIIIANDFFNSFTGLLHNAKDFNFTFPFNAGLAVVNTAFLLVLLLNGQYSIAAFLLLTLIYTNARSNPLTSSERDYQSAVYIMISMANMTFLLPYLSTQLNKTVDTAKKVIFSALLLLVGLYAFFTFLFLVRKFNDKVFGKYMGKAPLIYDRPQLAPIMNRIVTKDDTMWIGPFEFEELYYAHGKLPSRYHILIPGMGKSAEVQQQMIIEFSSHKPKVMLFDKRFFILGNSPEMFAQFFLNFLSEYYVTLFDYRRGGVRFVSVAPITERVDLETKLYIRKDMVDEVIERLIRENMIRPQ